MRFHLTVLAAAFVASGCASSGPIGKDVLAQGAKPSTGRLVIYRNNPIGFAVQPDYLLNGKRIGSSQPNGFVVCDLSPGKYQLSVGNFELNVNFGGGSDKATVHLQAGRTIYVQAEPRLGLTVGVITLTQVTEGQGRSDTANLHKLESSC